MACNSCSAAIGAASSIDLLCWLGGAASGSCQYRTKIYRPCVCSARPNACLTRDVSVGAPITSSSSLVACGRNPWTHC
ncbi:hypothetical protein PR002_g32463 [Phytophthora rubi]|uniref:Secreted protein n=1 Tax=Phytophthora rubi TaxID=129364 RepID=A0A6A3G729_9STRA|nr:hypothetical protein PR002_g32463 [Phytophthora rubi]